MVHVAEVIVLVCGAPRQFPLHENVSKAIGAELKEQISKIVPFFKFQPGDGYDSFAPWGYYNTQPADLGAAYGPPVGYSWALHPTD